MISVIREIFFTNLLSTIFIWRNGLIYSRDLGRDIKVTTTNTQYKIELRCITFVH